MRCNDARQHWELYHDSEGDSELYLEINEHLAECPDCAKWFFRQGQLEDLVEGKLRNAVPTGELWSRIHDQCGLSPAVASRSWLTFSPLLKSPLLAVAATLLLAVGLWYFGGQRAAGNVPHLSALTSVCHQRLIGGDQPLEFVSQSDREVETYLKSRVPFPVHCPPRKDAGFAVRGGGVCTIAGEAAAYVSGDVEGKDISIFILPEERLTHFAHERDVLSREAVHHCREGDYDMVLAKMDRNVLVVIGRTSPEQLERVARAYGTYHGTPAAEAAAPQGEAMLPNPHLQPSDRTGSGVLRGWPENSSLSGLRSMRIESRDSCNSAPGPFLLSMSRVFLSQ